MRLSIIQPEIIRGDIEHNTRVIQRLIDTSEGDLLVLPEYALTGSLVLDEQADVREWVRRSAAAKAALRIPAGKYLLVNALAERDGHIANCCELLPTLEHQCKLHPDRIEQQAGITPGHGQHVFELLDKRFKVIICTDMRQAEAIPTDGLDFVLWVFHFTNRNYAQAMADAKHFSAQRGVRLFACSLVSDVNIGHSAYIDGQVRLSLREEEGILEVILP